LKAALECVHVCSLSLWTELNEPEKIKDFPDKEGKEHRLWHNRSNDGSNLFTTQHKLFFLICSGKLGPLKTKTKKTLFYSISCDIPFCLDYIWAYYLVNDSFVAIVLVWETLGVQVVETPFLIVRFQLEF